MLNFQNLQLYKYFKRSDDDNKNNLISIPVQFKFLFGNQTDFIKTFNPLFPNQTCQIMVFDPSSVKSTSPMTAVKSIDFGLIHEWDAGATFDWPILFIMAQNSRQLTIISPNIPKPSPAVPSQAYMSGTVQVVANDYEPILVGAFLPATNSNLVGNFNFNNFDKMPNFICGTNLV